MSTVKKILRKVKRTISPNKTPDNPYIAEVVKATGWSAKYARQQMTAVKEKYSISFRLYSKYKLYNLSGAEFNSEILRIQRLKTDNSTHYEEMSQASGLSYEDLKNKYLSARSKYGVNLPEYHQYELWKFDGDELQAAVDKINEDKRALELNKKLNRASSETRQSFILSKSDKADASAASSGDGFPEPIKVACACFGKHLPENAVKGTSLDQYIGEIDCSLKSLRNTIGAEIIPDTPEIAKEYRLFKRKFKQHYPFKYSDTNMAVCFVDYLLFCYDYGFDTSDYFEYQLYFKDIPERNTFMSQGYRTYIRVITNSNVRLFKNKQRFNDHFGALLKRDWMKVTDANHDEFIAFAKAHDKFISKPTKGTGGVGNEVFSTENEDLEKLYEFCRDNECIIEEVLVQHPDMAAFCDSVANTVRLYTLYTADGEMLVTGGAVKFSREGISADNVTSGGLAAAIDPKTGIVISGGMDKYGEMHDVHPDSGLPFKGFQIPCWDKVLQIALDGAEMVKNENRHIGWDIAITEKGEAAVIEGNSGANIALLQLVDRVGKKSLYYPHLHEIAAAMGKEDYVAIPENILSADSEEDANAIYDKLNAVRFGAEKKFTYKDNLWLEKYEIKGPDYDYLDRPVSEENVAGYEPARFEFDGEKWIPKDGTADAEGTARLMFTGDITCFEKQMEVAEYGQFYDFDYVFDHIKGIFGQSSLAVGNLETMIVPEAPYRTEVFISEQNFLCNAPVEFLDAVRKSGIDCITNANNHDMDTGAVGIGETIDYAELKGLIQTGTFKTDKKHFEMFRINGINIAIVALTSYHNYKEDNFTKEGKSFLLNSYSKRTARNLYKQAKEDGADIVIMCMHWGREYVTEYNDRQVELANILMDIGYDVIVGSHPHVLQPFEIMTKNEKNVPVFFSMGNLVTHHIGNERARSIIACIDLKRDGDDISIECSCIPICVTDRYGEKAFTIVPLKKDSSSKNNVADFDSVMEIIGEELPVNEEITFDDCPQKDKEPEEAKPKKKTAKLRMKDVKEFPVHFDGGKFEYDIYEDHALITGVSEGVNPFALTMNQQVKGRPVTGITDGAFQNGTMKKMSFSLDLGYVSDRAFKDCKYLEGVFQFTDNIKWIGVEAYENCESLRCIVIKSNVKEIREHAFRNCTGLRSVKISGGVETIADNAFEGCDRVVFYCPKESPAWNYANSHGIEAKEMDI